MIFETIIYTIGDNMFSIGKTFCMKTFAKAIGDLGTVSLSRVDICMHAVRGR